MSRHCEKVEVSGMNCAQQFRTRQDGAGLGQEESAAEEDKQCNMQTNE